MNRIFHARIAAGQYLFVALAGVIAVYGLWEKQILIAVLFMLLLVVSIEKLILRGINHFVCKWRLPNIVEVLVNKWFNAKCRFYILKTLCYICLYYELI